MRSPRLNPFLAAMFIATIFNLSAATVTWDGGGGNFSWQTPANWSGDVLPNTLDDVVINVGGGITVTSTANVTIRSLQCSNHLALTAGTFRVTTNASVVQGQLFVIGNPVLSASGPTTTFALPAATNIDGVGLEALSNATLTASQVIGYSRGAGCFTTFWQATGGNGQINLPALASLTGPGCASHNLQVSSGGKILLPALTNLADGTLSFLADGVNALIDLPLLATSDGTRAISLEAKNGGTIWSPLFVGGKTVTPVLRPLSTLPMAQFTSLAGFTVAGTNVNFPLLTNLYNGSINVSSNAVVTMTNLFAYIDTPSCAVHTWQVSGTGSVLNVSQLRSMSGPGCGALEIRAFSGARCDFSGLTNVAEGTLTLGAQGTNSVMDLSALTSASATVNTVTLEAGSLGQVIVPQLFGGPALAVTIVSNGILPAGQMRELRGFTVTASAVNFAALTNLTAGVASVTAGGNVSTPLLTSHSQASGCHGNWWEAVGAGSVLNLSALTNFTGAGCGAITLRAGAGGTLTVNNLASVKDGSVIFEADGAGSLVNLAALTNCGGPRIVTFSALNSGTISAPLTSGGTNVFVSLDSNGVVPTGQLRLLNGFDVNAMTVVFSVLTNLGIGNVTVSGGGNVSAPFLTAHAESAGCVGTVWKSIGAGSILNFSAITNLTGADCGALTIQAVLGGTVQLSGVVSIGEGSIAMVADGAGSLIQLSSLAESESLVRNVSFEARNSGTVAMPAFEGGETVIITIRSGGALDTAQLKLLKSLTVSATTVSIPGITNLFAGSLIVEAGAVLNLPNLTNHNQGSSCAASSWTADGAGSVLNLPGLKRLTGGTCVPLKIQALNSGQAVLSGLTHVPAGRVQIIASGSGSLVNLLSLSNLVSHPLVSELIVTNNGAAQLNREGLVFDGVNIRTLTSNGAPPPVNLTNASRVVLFGRPWRSYWVETRRTTSPTNVWTFFQRVPLTNDFQTIVPQGVADTEFSAREFVADPPWFDISVPAGTNIQLILFAATNHGYDLENATNLTSAAWGSLGTVTMTNTFRILDPVPNQKPAQFFRSKTL